METRRKGRHGQSEESEAVSPSSPDRESEQESPESGEKGEGMSITELVRWLAAREDEATREAEERERRRDEKIVQALNAMEEKQAAFAAELRTRATAQPEPEGHPPVKAGSRETTSEQEAAEVPSTLWQVLRHLEEGRKEERRLLVETLGGEPDRSSIGSSRAAMTLSITCWRSRGLLPQRGSRRRLGWSSWRLS